MSVSTSIATANTPSTSVIETCEEICEVFKETTLRFAVPYAINTSSSERADRPKTGKSITDRFPPCDTGMRSANSSFERSAAALAVPMKRAHNITKIDLTPGANYHKGIIIYLLRVSASVLKLAVRHMMTLLREHNTLYISTST